MNKEISKVLKDRLLAKGGLPFADLISGMAQTVEYKEANEDGNTIIKRMPVSYDTNSAEGCRTTPETALVPDSGRRGIVYFEDQGVRYKGRASGGAVLYQSTLTLVCWMNKARFMGKDFYTDINPYCITQITSKLKAGRLINSGIFAKMNVTPTQILPQDARVFAKYTYNETVTQYLRPPFEFFGIVLNIDYQVHPECIESLIIKDPACY